MQKLSPSNFVGILLNLLIDKLGIPRLLVVRNLNLLNKQHTLACRENLVGNDDLLYILIDFQWKLITAKGGSSGKTLTW
jgi:hypothetical protein